MKTKTTAKKPKAKTPPPPPTSPARVIQDTAKSNTPPPPSSLSVAGASPVEVATIAAHLSHPGITAKDCVARAYELLELAAWGQTALRHSFHSDFKPSGIADWVRSQKDAPAANDPKEALHRITTDAVNAVTHGGMTKKEREKSETDHRKTQKEDERCRKIVLKHLRFDSRETPLPIDLEKALPLIIPEKQKKPLQDLLLRYLIGQQPNGDQKRVEKEARQRIEKWRKEKIPWRDFEAILFNYSKFKTDGISEVRSENGKKGVVRKDELKEERKLAQEKGKKKRATKSTDGRRGGKHGGSPAKPSRAGGDDIHEYQVNL